MDPSLVPFHILIAAVGVGLIAYNLGRIPKINADRARALEDYHNAVAVRNQESAAFWWHSQLAHRDNRINTYLSAAAGLPLLPLIAIPDPWVRVGVSSISFMITGYIFYRIRTQELRLKKYPMPEQEEDHPS